MNKKIIALLLVVALASTGAVFAKTGLGVQGGYTLGGGAGAALTFKLDSLPCVFAVDLGFWNGIAIGVTADWWIQNPKIEGTWGWFYGVGLAGSVHLGEPLGLAVAPRAVVGTNVFLLDKFLELYLQAAWQPTLSILPDVGFNLFSVPVNGGFRFWF